MELTSPHEHIKNKSTRGTILTKNWQKDSCTTTVVRKDTRKSIEKPGLHSLVEHRWTSPRQDREMFGLGYCFPATRCAQPCYALQPELKECSSPVHFMPQVWYWNQRGWDLEKDLSLRWRGDLVLGQSPGWAAVAEFTQAASQKQPRLLMATQLLGFPQPLCCVGAPLQAERMLWPCPFHVTVWHQLQGSHNWGKDTTIGCILGKLQTSKKAEHWISAGTQALFDSAFSSFMATVPSMGSRENTYLMGMESAQAHPSGLLLSQLGIRFSP